MQISQKDKSLILLVMAALAVLWVLYSLLSYLFFNATFSHSDVSKIAAKDQASEQWFNLSRPLEQSDLKGRLVLLDFWTYSCVSCMEILPEIQKLEQRFGNKLLVISVHSAKFDNDKDANSIKKAILRHNITSPVINDSSLRIWNSFAVKSWPTLVLISPRGSIYKTYSDKINMAKVKKDIKHLTSKYKYEINRDPLPVALERDNIVNTILNSPTKIKYISDFSYKSYNAPALAISNSGKNNIVISSLKGDIILKIGSNREGFEDGTFDSASFNYPQGLLYSSGKLYVADTNNHALRMIDFKDGVVSTIIGSGQKGKTIGGKSEALDANSIDLSSPTDLEFFPDRDNIVIANSGTHQILSYNIKKNIVLAIAGDGSNGFADGKYPNNSLSQTSDMAVFGKKLYFVDAQGSSLRALGEGDEVTTLIGGAGKFGHKNGDKGEALMQHPLGLTVDDTGAYIVDSYNNVIRKYDFSSKKIHDVVGAKKSGDKLGRGSATEFDEPQGIVSVLDSFYLADTNNNRILQISRRNFEAQLLDILPPLKLQKEGFLQYLPNLQKSDAAMVKADAELLLKINLNSGWKINEMGPSFINLLELVKENQANLVATFDWHSVQGLELKLPKLNPKKDYVLQGVIYYCQDKKNALCYVKSYQQKVVADGSEKNDKIELKLAY